MTSAMKLHALAHVNYLWFVHLLFICVTSLVRCAGLREKKVRHENFTVPYGENAYGYYGPDGTDYPCLTSEDCMHYYNGSDPLDDAILIEEEALGEACIVKGHLKESKNWKGYLAKPVLRAQYGRIYFRFLYSSARCCVRLLLYVEEQVAALRARMNCLQRQSVLDPKSDQVITLAPSFENSGCRDNRTDNGEQMIECSSGRTIRSDIDRKWYIAVSSCGSPDGLNLQFELEIYGYSNTCDEIKDIKNNAACGVHRPSYTLWISVIYCVYFISSVRRKLLLAIIPVTLSLILYKVS